MLQSVLHKNILKEVVIMTKTERISVRLTDEEDKILKAFKDQLKKQGLDVSESEIVRLALKRLKKEID